MICRDTTMNAAERAEHLLSIMTLEEKIAQTDMLRGVEYFGKEHPAHFCSIDPQSEITDEQLRRAFDETGVGFVHDAYTHPRLINRIQRYVVENTRLGIPLIFTGEALHGLCCPDATVFPSPIAIAATFDPEVAQRVGEAIAVEARASGITEILAPNLDVARDPRWGRVEETFGEDTYLASAMGRCLIQGEQGEDVSAPDKVVAEPKHFCVHGTPEGGLNCATARVGRREIETEYLPVFEAGIREAGAYNAMACYNTIDGEPVVSSPYYLTDILRNRFGMRGYVRADFGAIARLYMLHGTAADAKDAIRQALLAGLCVQGFDFPSRVWRDSLKALVQEGEIALSVLDEAVRRILLVKFALGLFDRPYVEEKRYASVIRCSRHLDIARETARKSVCLVKNENGVLPLAKTVRRVAVLGPGSGRQYVGGYSPIPYSYRPVSVYEQLCDLLPQTEVRRADGCGYTTENACPMPAAWFTDGVCASFYADDCFKEAVGNETYQDFQFHWIAAKPRNDLPFRGYSVRFEAMFRVNPTDVERENSFQGELVFECADWFRLWVDGALVGENQGVERRHSHYVPFYFEKDTTHRIVVEFVCDAGAADIVLSVRAGDNNMQEAVELARQSDVAIVVCGEDKESSGEGKDRCSLQLTGAQMELIRAVHECGKPMIVAVQCGRPLELEEACTIADAMLVQFFGGDFGGVALAEAIAGVFSPSGRLPISFPRSIGQIPTYYSRLPGRSDPNYYEGSGANLFPFGFGLSYTSFAYSCLHVIWDGNTDAVNAQATVCVENTGMVEADEVVQLYVHDVVSSVSTPTKRLRGVQRIRLQPGEKRELRFSLAFRDFCLLNRDFQWVVEPGEFQILVGPSSEDIRLTETIAFWQQSAMTVENARQ